MHLAVSRLTLRGVVVRAGESNRAGQQGCDSSRLASFPVFGLLFKRFIRQRRSNAKEDMHAGCWKGVEDSKTVEGFICVGGPRIRVNAYYVIGAHRRDANKTVVGACGEEDKVCKTQL